MVYNKNIIIDILQREFRNEIEEYVEISIMKMDGNELDEAFDYNPFIDFAVMDCINEMNILSWEVEEDVCEKDKQVVSGTLEISVQIAGYTNWENENIVDTNEINVGFHFAFLCVNGKYMDLEMEHIY